MAVMLSCVVTSTAQAQLELLLDGYEEKYYNHDEGPGVAIKKNDAGDARNDYIYEVPTVAALSYLFWAVNLYNLSNNWAIDHFMQINECELYRTYGSDELEWSEIRDATRVFIRENSGDFPTRFEFIIPIKLEDYDTRKKAFKIQKEYEIVSLRRFEVLAKDYKGPGCTYEMHPSHTLPRSLVLEFSRPFTLTHIPMSEDVANEFIKKKALLLKRHYKGGQVSRDRMYNLRDAYLLLKVKIFTHGKLLGVLSYDVQSVQMLSILEGFEIYEDSGGENLFYEQNYTTSKTNSKRSTLLNEQYKALRERSELGGILH